MKKLFVCIVSLVCALVLWAGSYPVKPGEKIVFFGDSITHGGRYITFLQLMLDSRGLRDADLINCGVSGDTAGGGLRRLDRDVLARKPDRVFVLFGMNDIGRGNYAEDTPAGIQRRKVSLDGYARNQKELVKRLKVAGVRVVLMTPTAYDQYQPGGKSDRCNEPGLSDAAKIVRDLAKAENLDVVELHSAMTAILKTHPEMHFCGKDLVHPLDMGHLVMASLIAEQIGMTGPVAEVSVNVKNGKYTAKYAKMEKVSVAPEKVSFRYCPERLAVDVIAARGANIEKVYPFAEKLNRESLTVTGLAAGDYAVTADGKQIGKYSEEALAKGIDLAGLDTPAHAQAAKAMKTMWKLHSVHARLRNLELCRSLVAADKTLDMSDTQAVITALEKWLAGKKKDWAYRKYYTNQVNNFKRDAVREPAMKAEREKLRRQLAVEAVPVSYNVTITKSK